jgi:hypothetical protein
VSRSFFYFFDTCFGGVDGLAEYLHANAQENHLYQAAVSKYNAGDRAKLPRHQCGMDISDAPGVPNREVNQYDRSTRFVAVPEGLL